MKKNFQKTWITAIISPDNQNIFNFPHSIRTREKKQTCLLNSLNGKNSLHKNGERNPKHDNKRCKTFSRKQIIFNLSCTVVNALTLVFHLLCGFLDTVRASTESALHRCGNRHILHHNLDGLLCNKILWLLLNFVVLVQGGPLFLHSLQARQTRRQTLQQVSKRQNHTHK